MNNNNEAKFIASYSTPDINHADYWIDLNEDKYGGVIKYFDKDVCEWRIIQFDQRLLDQLLAWFTCALSSVEDALYKEIGKLSANTTDDLKKEIKELSSQVTELNSQVSEINKQIGELNSQVEDTVENSNSAITSVNALALRITTVEQQITEINNTFTDQYIGDIVSDAIASNSTDILDSVQKAINTGVDIELPLPSVNNNKLSLPIWIGTGSEHDLLNKPDNDMIYFVTT